MIIHLPEFIRKVGKFARLVFWAFNPYCIYIWENYWIRFGSAINVANHHFIRYSDTMQAKCSESFGYAIQTNLALEVPLQSI